MFQKEKSTSNQPLTTATLISTGTVLHGDIQSENDLRIDGVIHGNVTSTAKIVVGPSGSVEGNISGSQADISGKVTGNITVKDLLQLRAKSEIIGDVAGFNLQVDAGASINGHCAVGGGANVVVMKETETHAKAR